jgi:hypothetical protein
MHTIPKKIFGCIGITIMVLASLFIAIALLNRTMMRSDDVMLRQLAYMVFPPKDYYDKIINKRIDVTQKGSTTRHHFKNQYKGRYIIGLQLEKFSYETKYDLGSKKYRPKLNLQIRFYRDHLLLMTIAKDRYSSYLEKKDRGGLIIDSYLCPKDIPLDNIITCEISVIEPDIELEKKHGPIRYFIQKISDK